MALEDGGAMSEGHGQSRLLDDESLLHLLGKDLPPRQQKLLEEIMELRAQLATARLAADTATRARSRHRHFQDMLGRVVDHASDHPDFAAQLVRAVVGYASSDAELRKVARAALRTPAKNVHGRPTEWTVHRWKNLHSMIEARKDHMTRDELIEWLQHHAGKPGTILAPKTVVSLMQKAGKTFPETPEKS